MRFSLVQINKWREKDTDPNTTDLSKEHSINFHKITEASWSKQLRNKNYKKPFLISDIVTGHRFRLYESFEWENSKACSKGNGPRHLDELKV